jgi:acetyl-CoA carboxylase biotin carboxyl carrier protein
MARSRSPRGSRAAKPVKSRAARADNSRDAVLGGVGLAELRRLIRLVQRTGIGELEVRSGIRTVRISAAGAMVAPATVPGSGFMTASCDAGAVAPAPPAASSVPAKAETHVAITSPMVGTFYRAPAPDADPYVEIGDALEVGQTVCIIEAMKLMNEIESEVRGRVVQILAENAQPVEFGQKLFLVEPL